MPDLATQQRAFAAAVIDAGEAMPAAPLFHGAPNALIERLAVYRGNWYSNASKALAGAYPVTAKIVGGEFFEALGREYLRRHPATSGDLNEYGAAFARFVAEFPHTQDLPYLPDVARLEWLVHRAHYAADAAPLDWRGLGGLLARDPARLRLALAPACALLESRWPLARIWEIHQDDAAGAVAMDLEAGPDRILVHRPAFRVAVTALTPGAYRFLERSKAGNTMAESLDAALAADVAFDLAASLRGWAEGGVVARITENDEEDA